MASYLVASDLGADYVKHEKFTSYTWIFVLDIIFAFFAAYGIGANDVANAFGTSVASRALTMRQALFIAAIFEFVGAFFLGAQVTGTISGGIAKSNAFLRDPELFMFGMMCVDLGVAIWLYVATYLELPVSTTHSVVGAVVGMTLVLKGKDAVVWNKKLDTFPYITGISMIVISWVTSPLLSAIGAGIIFFLVRTLCLRSAHPFERSFIVLPVVIGITTAINMMLLVTKAGKNYNTASYPTWKVQAIAWGCGGFMFLATLALMPLLKRKVLNDRAAREEAAKVADADADTKTKAESDDDTEAPQSAWDRFRKSTFDRDLHSEVKHIDTVNAITDNAEVFDQDAEECFKYLQVFTACCNSLAHGANDVANAIGPLAAVQQIWSTGSFTSKSTVKKWVLAVGAAGIVVGLATYGYNIIRAVGLKLTRITSTRGFAIELGSAMVVVVASNYALPVSTTHCLVGATIGVGALEGTKGINWLLFLKMIGGWLMTLIIAGGVTAIVVALGVFAPSAQMADEIKRYEDGLRLRSAAFQYAFDWEASQAFANPAGVVAPTLDPATLKYSQRVVPDHSVDGVPSDKSYIQWTAAYWKDATVWQKTAYMEKAWAQAIGYEAPDYSGQNSSTIRTERVFALFDKITQSAFSPNQQAELAKILSGQAILCCDEVYKCCPRTCSWKKKDENCTAKSKCELVKSDPTCKDKACSSTVSSSVGAATNCKVVATKDDCPMAMDMASKKNYVGLNYVSTPITGPPAAGDDAYGKAFTDYREPDYDQSIPSCPPKIA